MSAVGDDFTGFTKKDQKLLKHVRREIRQYKMYTIKHAGAKVAANDSAYHPANITGGSIGEMKLVSLRKKGEANKKFLPSLSNQEKKPQQQNKKDKKNSKKKSNQKSEKKSSQKSENSSQKSRKKSSRKSKKHSSSKKKRS